MKKSKLVNAKCLCCNAVVTVTIQPNVPELFYCQKCGSAVTMVWIKLLWVSKVIYKSWTDKIQNQQAKVLTPAQIAERIVKP